MRFSSGTDLVFQRLAPNGLEYRLEYPNGWNSKNLQKTAKALEAAYLLDRRHKKRRPWTSLDDSNT